MDVEAYRDMDRVRREAVPVRPEAGGMHTLRLTPKQRRRVFAGRPAEVVVDVLLLGLHGGVGEGGGLQGFCETYDVPYTGSSVLGSSVGMDKALSKSLCRDRGIPVLEFLSFREGHWIDHEEAWLDRCESELGYPLVVKPARLGSSIGIARVKDRAELDRAVEDALRYDSKVVVERALVQLKEINCAVLGDADDAMASVLEQPVRTSIEEMLTFQDKYMRAEGGGSKDDPALAKQTSAGPAGMASLSRLIPAPIDAETATVIRDRALQVFQLLECGGVARLDFLIDESNGSVYFNEINTIPGSFAFYLWEPMGISFGELVQRMIEEARKRHRIRRGRVRTYDVNLLSHRNVRNIKGSKSG